MRLLWLLVVTINIRMEYEDNGEYVFTVDKSLEKLQRVSSATPDKAVKVLYVRDNPEEPALPPDVALKELYLEQELLKLTSPQIQVHPVPKTEVEMDDRGHPSEGGTLTILKGINERAEDDLFLNREFATSKRLYAGVQGVYRFGCWTCDAKGGGGGGGRYQPPLGICDSCIAEKAAYGGAAKWDIFLASLSMPVDLPVEPPPSPPPPIPLRGWGPCPAGVIRPSPRAYTVVRGSSRPQFLLNPA